LKFWELDSDNLCYSIEEFGNNIYCVKNYDDYKLATCGWDTKVRFYDIKFGAMNGF